MCEMIGVYILYITGGENVRFILAVRINRV